MAAKKPRRKKSADLYVIVEKASSGAKPSMLADPAKLPPRADTTTDLAKARVYAQRKGPHRFLDEHAELKKRFAYRRLPAALR